MERTFQWIYCILFFLGAIMSVAGLVIAIFGQDISCRALLIATFIGSTYALTMLAIITLNELKE